MDVFNNANDTTQTLNEIDVSVLVGEGAKYKDVSELAKAYVHADGFIETLKSEKAKVTEELNSLKAKLEVYERIATKQITDQKPEQADKPAESAKATPPSEENLEDKIRSTLEAERERERKAANRNIANEKLQELYGDKAVEVLRTKAKELGVGLEWLTAVAETSPAAFFSTLGIQLESKPTGTPGVKNEINQRAMPSANAVQPNTYEYFSNLRKENPKAYYSAEVQRRMFEAAKSNPKFYG